MGAQKFFRVTLAVLFAASFCTTVEAALLKITSSIDDGTASSGDETPPPPLYGDVNLDGQLDISDLSTLIHILHTGEAVSDEVKANADVDRDNRLTYHDANGIAGYIFRNESLPMTQKFGDVDNDGVSFTTWDSEAAEQNIGHSNRGSLAYSAGDVDQDTYLTRLDTVCIYYIATGVLNGNPSTHPVLGDANGDGSVDIADVTFLNGIVNGGSPLPSDPLQFAAADVDGNTLIEPYDLWALVAHQFKGLTNLGSVRIRGDVNGNDIVEIGDLTQVVNFLYRGDTLKPVEALAADFNQDGQVTDADLDAFVSYLFGE